MGAPVRNLFGCGHATIPVEELYPRIGGFVGFHPMIELPLSFFTRITGEMGVHQFVFLERVEGYGVEIMKGYTFDPRDTMWIFSHSGINSVNIDVALEAKRLGMTLVAYGSAAAAAGRPARHSCGRTIFDVADVVVDTCAPIGDASVPVPGHQDKVGPISTVAFVTSAWMTVCTVAELLAARGVKLYINPSHNVPGDATEAGGGRVGVRGRQSPPFWILNSAFRNPSFDTIPLVPGVTATIITLNEAANIDRKSVV